MGLPMAMMLPFLEQQPLYNAANFNWDPWWSSYNTQWDGTPVNSTVFRTNFTTFMCPSDGLWAQNICNNNYAASIGTTTVGLRGRRNPTGDLRTLQPTYSIAKRHRRHVEHDCLLRVRWSATRAAPIPRPLPGQLDPSVDMVGTPACPRNSGYSTPIPIPPM